MSVAVPFYPINTSYDHVQSIRKITTSYKNQTCLWLWHKQILVPEKLLPLSRFSKKNPENIIIGNCKNQ